MQLSGLRTEISSMQRESLFLCVFPEKREAPIRNVQTGALRIEIKESR